jgi:hypothetical protein
MTKRLTANKRRGLASRIGSTHPPASADVPFGAGSAGLADERSVLGFCVRGRR